MKKIVGFILFFGLLGGAFAQTLQANATLRDVDGNVVGVVTLSEDGPVTLEVTITGFTAAAEGAHGFHIHETGACEPTFDAAGAHFSPDDDEHGFLNPQGLHAGDLPNLIFDEEGSGVYRIETLLISLSPDQVNSVFDADGSAIILHADPDDYLTDPGGGSGDRIACGVIVMGGSAEGN